MPGQGKARAASQVGDGQGSKRKYASSSNCKVKKMRRVAVNGKAADPKLQKRKEILHKNEKETTQEKTKASGNAQVLPKPKTLKKKKKKNDKSAPVSKEAGLSTGKQLAIKQVCGYSKVGDQFVEFFVRFEDGTKGSLTKEALNKANSEILVNYLCEKLIFAFNKLDSLSDKLEEMGELITKMGR